MATCPCRRQLLQEQRQHIIGEVIDYDLLYGETGVTGWWRNKHFFGLAGEYLNVRDIACIVNRCILETLAVTASN